MFAVALRCIAPHYCFFFPTALWELISMLLLKSDSLDRFLLIPPFTCIVYNGPLFSFIDRETFQVKLLSGDLL